MKKTCIVWVLVFLLVTPARSEMLGYHEIQTDTSGRIVPWNSAQPEVSYDDIIGRVWHFWKGLGNCSNGIPYFYQHQVWKPEGDPRGLGGDQLAMALSSLNLYYDYSGDVEVRKYMMGIADFVLNHGLSTATDSWPNLPYPYNMDLHGGSYDGDMRAGKGFLQPDKAASFGAELITLHEMTGEMRYFNAAESIADTLVSKMIPGDDEHSPWPFRVNAHTGEACTNAFAPYTANWTGALQLFDSLIRQHAKYQKSYESARANLMHWIRDYPLKTNKWGPFFEDVSFWSNTEINADTMAWYLLEYARPDDLQGDTAPAAARRILDWSYNTFNTNGWSKFGVSVIMEQTAYKVPGNSHTSRHASVELVYSEKSGNTLRKEDAIRQLNWTTYMVDEDGKNRYPRDDIWLTDGYGDYVRHYLRSMAAAPELAPSNQNHLLHSTSTIKEIHYSQQQIRYNTFDKSSSERLRIAFEPTFVECGGRKLSRLDSREKLKSRNGYYFESTGPLKGLLEIRHSKSSDVVISQ